jgi:hypothetical protein
MASLEGPGTGLACMPPIPMKCPRGLSKIIDLLDRADTVKRYGHLEPSANRRFVNALPGATKAHNPQPRRNQEAQASESAFSGAPASAGDFSELSGAGDGDRTRDVQLGKLLLDCKQRIWRSQRDFSATAVSRDFNRLAPAAC